MDGGHGGDGHGGGGHDGSGGYGGGGHGANFLDLHFINGGWAFIEKLDSFIDAVQAATCQISWLSLISYNSQEIQKNLFKLKWFLVIKKVRAESAPMHSSNIQITCTVRVKMGIFTNNIVWTYASFCGHPVMLEIHNAFISASNSSVKKQNDPSCPCLWNAIFWIESLNVVIVSVSRSYYGLSQSLEEDHHTKLYYLNHICKYSINPKVL